MPKATKTQKTKPHVYLLSDVNVAQAPADENTPRQFSGVANSGKPFSHYGEKTIIDLSDISYHDKVPALVSHDREKRAGFGVLSVENNQLIIKGTLLDNEFGNEVADDADSGFPWQMSAHVIPNQVDVLTEGTAEVNGQTVTTPITILRQCRVPEVSFTPTGVDDQTSAVVLSDMATQSFTPTPKDNTMTVEELKKLLDEEKAKNADLVKEKDALKAENETLKAENEKLKASETQANVDAQLSQAGFSKSDDGKWQGVSDTTYQVLLSQTADNAKAMIGDLQLSHAQNHNSKPNAPDYLFGEQHKPNGNGNQGGHQFSNSLVENAKARAGDKKTFI